VIFNS